MKISLAKIFARAVGCIALSGVAMMGAAAALPSAAGEGDTTSVAPQPATSNPALDIFINLVTPLFPSDRYAASTASTELSLLSTPEVINITANTPQGTIDQIIQAVKDTIIKNGGSVNRIIFVGDASTDSFADPMPNPECTGMLEVPDPTATFCSTSFTDILRAMVVLKNQEFPGHKAGESLANAIDTTGCDMFATDVGEMLPAREFSRLAAQLNAPIIASVTEVGYTVPDPSPLTGTFWAILPNGNVARLDGPPAIFGEDINANQSWTKGFTIQDVPEPVKDYPYSVVNTPAIAAIPGPTNSVTLQMPSSTSGNARIAAARRAGPGIIS